MTEIDLRCVDCIEGMDAMPPESVDVVVTSPPYNLGIKYRKYNDRQKHKIYLDWTKQWVSAVRRVLRPNGSFFLNLSGCPSKPYLPHEILLLVRDTFCLQNTFAWVKSISIDMPDGTMFSPGHFKPINSPRFVNDCFEPVYHFTKTGAVAISRLGLGVPYVDKSNLKRWKKPGGNDLRCRGNTWFIPYETIQSRSKQRPHPATFPPKLAEYAIRLHGLVDLTYAAGPERLTVLDPFVGIGNAAIGACRLKVGKFFGFDIDDSYLDDARKLLKAHFPEGT